jgi:hypothetical protein
VGEARLGGGFDPRGLDEGVGDLDVDELGASRVGRSGNRPDHLQVAGLAGDLDVLTGLNVGADADGKLGQGLDQVPVARRSPVGLELGWTHVDRGGRGLVVRRLLVCADHPQQRLDYLRVEM